MLDKIKTILTIALIVIVIFAIGYSIIKLIISAFETPELITMDTLSKYTKETNVITSYSTYFYYENCMKNLVEACQKELYKELYNIYIDDYKNEITNDEIVNKLKAIREMLIPKDIDDDIKYNLKKLYYAGTNYLAEIEINNYTIYLVFAETNSKEIDYNFALVK